MIPGNDTRIIRLGQIDITDRVISLPRLPRQKPQWGRVPDLPKLSINVRSDDFAFHPTHPVSLLFQKRIDTLSLEIEQFGRPVWSGFLIDYKANLSGKVTALNAETALQQKLHRSARLDSSAISPATAAKNLLILHGIPVDAGSFVRAENILNDIPVRVRINPSILEWQGTLADLLQLLASAGIGRFFLNESGQIGFDTYVLDDFPTVAFTITDDDMAQWPEMTDESMDPMDGYRIETVFGAVIKNGSEVIQTLDFGVTSAVQMIDTGSAVYCGDQWLALSNRIYNRIELIIHKRFAPIIRLDSFLRVDSVSLGIDRTVEVIGIDDADPRWIKVTVRMDKRIN